MHMGGTVESSHRCFSSLVLWFLTATYLGQYLLSVGRLFHTDEDAPQLYLRKEIT